MAREIVLYCDESDISGKHYSNFYGGAAVESSCLLEVQSRLNLRKALLNLNAELKWQKISETYAAKYIHFIDEVFDLVMEKKIKIRLMFTHNYFGARDLSDAQRENGFFLLYYQFIKHGFGFAHCGDGDNTTRLRIYFDKLPDADEKCAVFKGHVLGLNRFQDFKNAKLKIDEQQIAEVDSKTHVVMQALDVVMGAMQFRLNEKHREKPEGSANRGKRTIAKERVYKHVLARIRGLLPNFNIGISTGTQGDAANTWHHPYRHWVFRPQQYELRPQYLKK